MMGPCGDSGIKMLLVLTVAAAFCQGHDHHPDLELTYEIAEDLASLPLECYNKMYPFKFNNVWNEASEVAEHQNYVPIFSGCFDWHSSVHGHWLLASLLNRYPDSQLAERIVEVFDHQFQEEKVGTELSWFQNHTSFERTYGWSWFLKLHHELQKSHCGTHDWSKVLQPLADHLIQSYLSFLPKLIYPIRVGEHSNTAFGLTFPLQYALDNNLDDLLDLIRYNATGLYLKDAHCPLSWEPSGFDFLSPCLEEAALMGDILEYGEYELWLRSFLPSLFSEEFDLEPGHVIDRTDGKLVHLDGLNFSRAWSLYSIVLRLDKSIAHEIRDNLRGIADKHIGESMEFVVGSDYAGSHWLASFLTQALLVRERII